MLMRFIILLIFSTLYSNTEKIDINYSTFEELSTLPLSEEKIVTLAPISFTFFDRVAIISSASNPFFSIETIPKALFTTFTN